MSSIWAGVLIALAISSCLAGPPTRRRDIESLSAEELLSYRELVEAALDNGMYNTIAGWHGMPLSGMANAMGSCVHGTLSFLLWHRFYLSVMEMVIGCPIPYWNWRSSKFPRAFADSFYLSRTGLWKANPLRSVMLPPEVRTPNNPGPNTTRHPDSPLPYVDLQEKEDFALYSTVDFPTFSNAIEDCHNLAHTCLGGGMALLDVAAFDPIFWSLHMNTDRRWFQWQLMHDDVVYPEEIAQATILLETYSLPGSVLIEFFDGWTAGTAPGEIDAWKKSLKNTMQKRQKKFATLEDDGGLYNAVLQGPGVSPLMPGSDQARPTLPPMTRLPVHLPNTAAQAVSDIANAVRTPPSIDFSTPMPMPQGIIVHRSTPPARSTPMEPMLIVAPSPPPATEAPAMRAPPPPSAPETPFDDECPAPVREHLILTMENVASTTQPFLLETIINGRIVGRTGMFGMGSSPMAAFIMVRHVDLTRAYCRLGLNETSIEDLKPQVEFCMKNIKTGEAVAFKPEFQLHWQCY